MKYLAETLHEITKEKREDYAEYPACPNCGNAMVFTMSFPYKEWACLPCGETDEFFPRNKEIWRNIKAMDSKKRKWREELSIIARHIGGGKCAVEGCENGSCELCRKAADKNYQFKFWKSNLTPQ